MLFELTKLYMANLSKTLIHLILNKIKSRKKNYPRELLTPTAVLVFK